MDVVDFGAFRNARQRENEERNQQQAHFREVVLVVHAAFPSHVSVAITE